MPMRKIWDYTIDLKEKFVLKKGKFISCFERGKRETERVYLGVDKKVIYLFIKVTTDCASILCRKEG